LNKVTKDHGTALVTTTTSRKFPSKVVHYCGFGEHNPKVASHPEQRCFEKYPHLGKAAKAAKNASASLAHTSALAMFTSQERRHTFVVESAASQHMLSDWNLFSQFIPVDVKVKTGSSTNCLKTEGTGDASVTMGGKIMTLHNALCLPKISQKLIYLVQLIDTLVTIVKTGNLFDISDLALLSLLGFIVDHLLHVPYLCPSAYLKKSISASHDVWHMRLGHPGMKTMQTMGLPTSTNEKKCELCNCSKMTLQSFPANWCFINNKINSQLQKMDEKCEQENKLTLSCSMNKSCTALYSLPVSW
jgi:hypothetical protein